MIAIVLAVAAIVAYLEMANQHGTERADLLHPVAQPYDHTYDARRDEVVRRFGYDFRTGK